jgi:GNAT superfamily N-acetyltransferase
LAQGIECIVSEPKRDHLGEAEEEALRAWWSSPRVSGAVRIRLAEWSDRDALVALARAYGAEAAQQRGDARGFEIEDAAGVVESHLRSSHDFYLIADVGKVSVGFVRFGVKPRGCEVGEVFVAPGYRHRGIRQALTDQLERGLADLTGEGS